MGKKGGRKQRKGKSAAPAQDAPPAGNAAELKVDAQDELETPSRPDSPSLSASEPHTDDLSQPSPPSAAEVLGSTPISDEPPVAEGRASPTASPADGEDITAGLSAVNLESQEGDIGMTQEEVVPVEESVHNVKPEELEPEHAESAPEPSHQDEPLSGDLGAAVEEAIEPATSDLKHKSAPNSFPSDELDHTEPTERSTPSPPVESTSTHTNFEDLKEFEEVDIGADLEPSSSAAAGSSKSGHPDQPEAAESPSSPRFDSPRNNSTYPGPTGSIHDGDHPAERPSTSSQIDRHDSAAAAEQSIDSHSTSASQALHEVAGGIADHTHPGAVPDVQVDAGTPVSARSESKTPTALGPAFEESGPASIAHRRQLPSLSVTHTPPSNSPTPSEAPQTSPMLRSTSMSSSRVGIISPRSAKGSPQVLMSPKFRSIDAMYTDDEYDDDDGMEDMPMEGVPFESIPLDGDAEVPTGLSRQVSLKSAHSRNVSKESNVVPPTRTSLASNGHARVDSRGVPIVSDRPITPVSRAASAASAVATPRESPGGPSPAASPQVNPIPANANQQPSQALGVKGVNAFEKFVSRTRPAHLPPKDKSEDQAHLHEWESMMAQARQHDAEERRKQAARQAAREKRLLEVTPRWETLLNAKDFSAVKVRNDPAKRKLWFEGCPPRLRGKAWQLAIGNPLTLHKDAYKMYLKRSQRALEHGRFPQDILEQLEQDLDHTLNTLHIFQRGSPMRDELKELICAWVVYRSDESLGYAPYINLLAAMFLLVLPADQAFFSLVNFLSRPMLRAFYSETTDEIAAFYRVFENLQADTFPRIFANCKNLGLKLPEAYFRSVLVEQVPFDCALRLWDQIVLDGDGYVFRASLAIFGFLEPRLYYPDREEIQSVLDGHNKASMLIQERERERAKLRGEVYDHHVDGTLSVFGLTEEPLFEWLANDAWQESRFERLVVRELPD